MNELQDQLNKLNLNIDKIQSTIGYTFKNETLLVQAFTKDTFAIDYNKNFRDTKEDNKVLAYIGRKMYDLAITIYELNAQGHTNRDGEYIVDYDLDTLEERSQKINNECKNSVVIAINFFFTYLLIGINESNEVRVIPKVMSDLFEAIIGAIAVDSNYNLKDICIVSEKMAKIKSKLQMLDTIYKNLHGEKMMLV